MTSQTKIELVLEELTTAENLSESTTTLEKVPNEPDPPSASLIDNEQPAYHSASVCPCTAEPSEMVSTAEQTQICCNGSDAVIADADRRYIKSSASSDVNDDLRKQSQRNLNLPISDNCLESTNEAPFGRSQSVYPLLPHNALAH